MSEENNETPVVKEPLKNKPVIRPGAGDPSLFVDVTIKGQTVAQEIDLVGIIPEVELKSVILGTGGYLDVEFGDQAIVVQRGGNQMVNVEGADSLVLLVSNSDKSDTTLNVRGVRK